MLPMRSMRAQEAGTAHGTGSSPHASILAVSSDFDRSMKPKQHATGTDQPLNAQSLL
jgi:hypothetical protein